MWLICIISYNHWIQNNNVYKILTVTKTSLEQQTTDQLDEQNESQQLDGISSTNGASLDTL